MSSSALFVRALYDFNSTDSSSLSFKKNDIIQVLTQSETGWWDGLCGGKRGWFPSNYVALSDWILQHTPDGELFYYNTKTGDSSWDLPIDDDNDDDKVTFSGSTTNTNNTNIDVSAIGTNGHKPLPKNWIRQPTDNGSTYYYLNVVTREIRWTHPGRDSIAIPTKMQENIDDEESADKESISSSRYTGDYYNHMDVEANSNNKDDTKAVVVTDDHHLFQPSIDQNYQSSIPSYNNYNNTIHSLNLAVKQNEKHLYNSSTESIVENVRIMLYASGTIQKDSRIFRENLPLKTYHNQLVTAVSRLVISTKAAVNTAPNTWQSPETMLEKINDVYLAIQQYIQEAENTVKIKRINPKILKNSRVGGGWRGNNILSSASSSPPASPPISTSSLPQRRISPSLSLTLDVFLSLDNVSRNITKYLHVLILNIKKSLLGATISPSSPPTSTPTSPTSPLLPASPLSPPFRPPSSSSTSLTPQLVNSIRQIVSQIGQFLYYVEDLDLRELSEKNYQDSLNDFKVSKQTLYNSIANLAIFTQSAANPLSLPLLNNPLKQVLDYAIVVEKSVNNVIISIKFLVEESEIRSSAPDAPPTKRRVPHNFVPTINTTINNNVNNANNNINNYQIIEDPSSASSLMMDDDISRESDSPSFVPSTTSTITSSYSIPTTAISSSTTSLLPVPEGEIMNTTTTTTTTNNTSSSPRSPTSTTNTSSIISTSTVITTDSTTSTLIGGGDNFNENDDTAIPKSPVSENPSIITATSLGSRTFSSFTSRLRSNISVSTSNTAYDNSSNISQPSLPSSSTSSLQTPTIKTPAKSNEQSPPLSDDPKPLHENNPPGEELWFLDYDYREIDIIFINESKTTVKGGTLDALIERLTMHDLLDSNFNATFLLTYRSFCDSDTFLEKLIDRFIIKPPEGMTPSEKEIWQEKKQTPIRLRVLSIMKSWLEHYYMDDQDSHCLTRMKEFASTVMSEHMSFASVGLIKIIEKRQFQPGAIFRELINTSPILPPQPILPRNLRRIKFLDLNPLEIARQLTIIESRLYNKIRPVECLNKAWSKEEGGEIAKNIKAMIVNRWVAEMILNNPDIRRRCALIKHFVAVADKCLLLNNFNSLTAIISGLNSAPIHRLRRTWETASQKTITLLEGLNRVMNSTKNFFAYRETLHSVNPPCVPFLGVYLTDLTFIEDGNPNILKKQTNIINFSKRMKTAEVIREIQQYQSVPYNLTSVQEIQVFIETNLKDSDDVANLYDKKDEKIARLLQESGFL
ncbi:1767_t:CDS:10 [Entrophospora sp. SA101]|nr:1767_t:CDS:10 [Entrophospora sp. SA101]